MKNTNLKTVKNNPETFDNLFDQDEKEVAKQVKYTQCKEGKKMQLVSQINNIRMQLMKREIDYKKSLTDPLVNSIDIRIDIMSLEREMSIAKDIYNQLFPNEKFII